MSIASLLELFAYFLPVCLLSAGIALIGFHSFKKSRSKLQDVGVLWSVLVALIALELGGMMLLRFSPWVYHFAMIEFIGLASLSMVPVTLTTFVVLKVSKVNFFTEHEHPTVEMLYWSLLVAGVTLVIIVFKVYDVQLFSQYIHG